MTPLTLLKNKYFLIAIALAGLLISYLSFGFITGVNKALSDINSTLESQSLNTSRELDSATAMLHVASASNNYRQSLLSGNQCVVQDENCWPSTVADLSDHIDLDLFRLNDSGDLVTPLEQVITLVPSGNELYMFVTTDDYFQAADLFKHFPGPAFDARLDQSKFPIVRFVITVPESIAK